MVFSAIVLMQMANAFECRSNPASLFSIGPMRNRLLLGAIGAEALMLAAFVYVSVLSHALGQHALSADRWLPILIVPWILLAAEETRKAVVRRRHGGVG